MSINSRKWTTNTCSNKLDRNTTRKNESGALLLEPGSDANTRLSIHSINLRSNTAPKHPFHLPSPSTITSANTPVPLPKANQNGCMARKNQQGVKCQTTAPMSRTESSAQQLSRLLATYAQSNPVTLQALIAGKPCPPQSTSWWLYNKNCDLNHAVKEVGDFWTKMLHAVGNILTQYIVSYVDVAHLLDRELKIQKLPIQSLHITQQELEANRILSNLRDIELVRPHKPQSTSTFRKMLLSFYGGSHNGVEGGAKSASSLQTEGAIVCWQQIDLQVERVISDLATSKACGSTMAFSRIHDSWVDNTLPFINKFALISTADLIRTVIGSKWELSFSSGFVSSSQFESMFSRRLEQVYGALCFEDRISSDGKQSSELLCLLPISTISVTKLANLSFSNDLDQLRGRCVQLYSNHDKPG